MGEGAFGKVKLAKLIKDPTKRYAIKSIPRELIDRNLDSKYKGYLGDEDAEFDETQMYELLQSEI